MTIETHVTKEGSKKIPFCKMQSGKKKVLDLAIEDFFVVNDYATFATSRRTAGPMVEVRVTDLK